MNSTMTVQAIFDFRGDTFNYQADIVLPLYIDDVELFLEQLPHKIAKQNQLEIISYKFEMLESSAIEVISFKSRIESAMPQLPIMVREFIDVYQSVGPEAYLQKIAEAYEIDLSTNPKLAKAIKAAYMLGKEHRLSERNNPVNLWLNRGFT